jgi:hypothetical protein
MKSSRTLQPLPVFGIDYSKPGEHVAARATKDCRNVLVKRSLIQKRPGVESAGASLAERVQYMVELEKGNGTTYFLRIGPTKFEELNKTTLAWTSRASAPLTGATSDQISAALPLLGGDRILVYTNGKDAIRKFVGGGNDAVLGGTPPLAKFLLAFGNYLLLLNITSGGDRFPWRVQWSDTGDPENWNPVGSNAGSAELLDDSQDITGAGHHGQGFTIHKENGIYVAALTNSSAVFAFERRETGAGTVANKTILSLPSGEQLFLARDGLRLFNGITAPSIEAPINDELRDSLNPEFAYKSWGKIIKELDEAWIGVPIGSDDEPSTIYKFNYVTRQVYKDIRPDVTAVTEYKNTQGQLSWNELPSTWDSWVGPWDNISLASLNPIYIFGYADGSVKKQNTGSSDDGTAIEARWDSKDLTSLDFDEIGVADLLMRWQEIRIWAKGSGSIDVYYSLNGGTSYIFAGSIPLTADFPDDNASQVVYIDKVSVRCGIRLIHNGDNQTFHLKQYALVAVQREKAGN